MGYQFTLDDEASAIAIELAADRASTPEAEVARLLHEAAAEKRRIREEAARMMAAVERFAALFGDDKPSSNHDWLYDENGLPH